MATNSKTSILVNSQVPHFVREDYSTFIAFLQAYYEYLEQSNNTVAFGKVLERSKNLRDYLDVDKTLDDFSERLYAHFLQALPKDAVADRDLILKNVQDFYRARGTEKALKFLLRVLIGQEAELYYPKRDILKWSDGKWYVQKSLRVSNTAIDGTANTSYAALNAFRSTRITGNTSNATAIIEKVDRFVEGGTSVDELILSSVKGDFDDGETVRANFLEAGTSRFITANVFPSFINRIIIDNPGLDYSVGDYLVFSPSGGANAYVSLVTTGNITSLLVVNGGAGFKANDIIVFSGGGGSGANARVGAANTDETYHPNSYANICNTIIADLAGTTMSTANYPNMNYAIVNSPNANTRMIDALRLFTITNVGPVFNAVVISSGTGYVSTPEVGAIANAKLAELGILGRMNIISGGTGYKRGDVIEFFNQSGGSGTGAKGNVTQNVDANGMITAVRFVANGEGVPIGGWGYESGKYPRVNVRSSTGTGANIVIEALLGEGDTYQVGSGSFGAIQEITLVSRGSGFVDTPDITVQGGDGNAQVSCEILRGVFTYPGRYTNDDGQLSGYNFLQNRDYYQNYSYVVRVRESLAIYRKALLDINHPAGMKLFGERIYDASDTINCAVSSETVTTNVLRVGIVWTGNGANFVGGGVVGHRHQVANTGNSANGDLVFVVGYESDGAANFANIANVIINNTYYAVRLVSANGAASGFNNGIHIYALRNFPNTNAFINVVWTSSQAGNTAITAYRVKTANILNTYTTNVNVRTVSGTTGSLKGLTILGNGAGIMATNWNDPSFTATWFNATEQDDLSAAGSGTNGFRHSTAYVANLNTAFSGTNTNVTATSSGSASRHVMVGVTWIIDG